MAADKIDLIKMVIEEWANTELSSAQAMMNITVIVGCRKPSPEYIKWAKGVLNGS